MKKLLLCIILLFSTFSASADITLTVQQLRNFVEDVNSNSFTRFLAEQYAPEVIEAQQYITNGGIIFKDSISYSQGGCSNKFTANADIQLKLLDPSELLRLGFDSSSKEIRLAVNLDAEFEVLGYGNAKKRERDIFNNCVKIFEADANIDISSDLNVNVLAVGSFNPELTSLYNGTVNQLRLNPVVYIKAKAILDNTVIDSDVDITPESIFNYTAIASATLPITLFLDTLLPGLHLGLLSSSVIPALGITGTLESYAEDFVQEELTDAVAGYAAELNIGKEETRVFDPIIINLPSDSLIDSDLYRKVMSKEGIGGYNCGPGKLEPNKAFAALYAGEGSQTYDQYIQPEINCRAGVLVSVLSMLL